MVILKNGIPVTACDIIFLSYDEPNAEENWEDLKKKYPKAKRVHGIKGFNSAHRECAKLSETERFITIDGDNIVYPHFFKHSIEINLFNSTKIISWFSKNNINGLIYGNGGIKCWYKPFALIMKSHEKSKDKLSLDFYATFPTNRITHESCFSETIINKNPFQAWKSGFREGVKLPMNRNEKISIKEFLKKGNQKHKEWLHIWFTKGFEIENGPWAIYGAMMGCYLLFFTNFDLRTVFRYDQIYKFWNKQILNSFLNKDGTIKEKLLLKQINKLQDFFNEHLPFQREVRENENCK